MNSTIAQLEAFVSALFKAAGMDSDKATTLSQLLVLTDAMGRRTHGLAMVPLYLAELAKGTMSKSGEPEVVKQRGVVA
ncbi:MAG TPA: Ldh family oxidoreductase, partial [Burkholderiaceae bacterium]|nr:Ldh family oxidoreductase [Burkholderiaceae bacterium]